MARTRKHLALTDYQFTFDDWKIFVSSHDPNYMDDRTVTVNGVLNVEDSSIKNLSITFEGEPLELTEKQLNKLEAMIIDEVIYNELHVIDEPEYDPDF